MKKVILSLLISSIASGALLAGDYILAPDKDPAVYAPESGWEFDFNLYVWAANIKGDVGVAGTASAIDIGFDDILDNLNMVTSFSLGARKDKFGLFADFMYVEIAPSFETPGPLFGRTDLTLAQTLLDLKASYRIAEWNRGWLEITGGGRYMNVDLDITLQPGLLPLVNARGNDQWWDAVGGFRAQHFVSDRTFLLASGDVGGGSSNLTWQAEGGLGFQMTESVTANVTYRYLDYDYQNGGFTYDVSTRGFVIGLGIQW